MITERAVSLHPPPLPEGERVVNDFIMRYVVLVYETLALVFCREV
ncbi:hypothetical protein [Limnospira sp. PMC 289.06]|nr:hypothetical protein [Limnospira sp. PMC 289.06]